MTRVVAIANQKGGVGKTTTSVNVSTAFAIAGKRTLLIDLDPQGNSSTGLGISDRSLSIYDVLVNEVDTRSAIKNTNINNLCILPSVTDLYAIEIELIKRQHRESILKSCIKDFKNDFDYIFIDCPPSLGMLTVNALTAADSVVIPSQCEFYALEGLSHLLNSIKLIQKTLNRNLYIDGILLTMYDSRNKLTELVEQDIRLHLNDKVYNTVIPRNIRLSEAPSHGKPAIIYDYKCSGSQAYTTLAKEILQRYAYK